MGRSEHTLKSGCTHCHEEALAAGPILLPLENPAYAPSALQVARIVGRAIGRGLLMAHAASRPLWPAAVLARVGLALGEAGESVVVPLAGDPAQAVIALAEASACSLIVMGLPSPRNGRQDLGAVRETVLGRAPCPVLLVPPGMDETWGRKGRVLVPHDGTPSTTAALPLATILAHALGARLVLLHVATAPPAESGALVVPRFLDQPQHEWQAWRAEFLALCGCPGSLDLDEVDLVIGTGPPVEAILATAASRDPDAIVLGWHGRLDHGHAEVLKQVLRRSAWPVLVHRLPD